MIRPPRRSTLFPSTTVSRSGRGTDNEAAEAGGRRPRRSWGPERGYGAGQQGICGGSQGTGDRRAEREGYQVVPAAQQVPEDRKSTRLNSSHANISYAVFCLK